MYVMPAAVILKFAESRDWLGVHVFVVSVHYNVVFKPDETSVAEKFIVALL